MRNRKREYLDFYKTPTECVNIISDYSKKFNNWWECCAGDGAIVDAFPNISLATDINPRRNDIENLDILTCSKPNNIDAVITNPPFVCADKIVEKILFEFELPLLFLMRVEYMNALKRKHLHKHINNVMIISNLIKFETEEGRIINGNGTGRCAWFFMTPKKNEKTNLDWLYF